MANRNAAFLPLVILTLLGCSGQDRRPDNGVERRDKPEVVERLGEPDIVYVDDTDPMMLSAISKARSTVGQFIEALSKPQPSQSRFSVKVPIRDGDSTEHMWLIPVHYQDGKFSGTIDNEPDKVKTIKLGDTIDVKTQEISDWMYVDNGKLVGGYTIRVLRDAVPPEKRREFDRSVPFTIE